MRYPLPAPIWAAKQGHLNTARILLEAGADPAIRDQGGKNALDWALSQGHAAVAEYLQATRNQHPRSRPTD